MASLTVVGVIGASHAAALLSPLGVTVVSAGGAGPLADVHLVRRRRVDGLVVGRDAVEFAGIARWVERQGVPWLVVDGDVDAGVLRAWVQDPSEPAAVVVPAPPAPPVPLPPPAAKRSGQVFAPPSV